jgi:acyl-CoA reductase-like NAD-dependent aldehyde dehydrogenase
VTTRQVGSDAGLPHISETGVGQRRLMKAAADTMKRVTLELGGKSPSIDAAQAHACAARRFFTQWAFASRASPSESPLVRS